jgi:hypothetical protein
MAPAKTRNQAAVNKQDTKLWSTRRQQGNKKNHIGGDDMISCHVPLSSVNRDNKYIQVVAGKRNDTDASMK